MLIMYLACAIKQQGAAHFKTALTLAFVGESRNTIKCSLDAWCRSWTGVCSPHLWSVDMAVPIARALRRLDCVITAAQLGRRAAGHIKGL